MVGSVEAKQFVFRGSKLGPVGVEKAHKREEKLQQCLGVDGGEFSGFSLDLKALRRWAFLNWQLKGGVRLSLLGAISSC